MTHPGSVRRNRNRNTADQQRALEHAHATLTHAITAVFDDGGRVACVTWPGLFQEPDPVPRTIEGRRQLAAARAACHALCAACPVVDKCYAYTTLAKAQGHDLGDHVPTAAMLRRTKAVA